MRPPRAVRFQLIHVACDKPRQYAEYSSLAARLNTTQKQSFFLLQNERFWAV